ncbi:hypothetical protein ACQKEY_00550 [Lysinibacillus fusiformis]|uniref:hypothetical protein n=1 Tax=Lysinibacillus fusiformis TaxID=28031 RepID=UPI003CFE499D
MKNNILLIVSIIMLFVLAFFFSNWHYFSNNHPQMVHEGVVKIEKEQLRKPKKLEGDWAFYPNVLIPSWEKLDNYENKRLTLDVPFNWEKYIQPNEEGLEVGTYHVKVEVPTEGLYGLYLRSIRQANRVFINRVEGRI